jgi:vitamin B12 transporter
MNRAYCLSLSLLVAGTALVVPSLALADLSTSVDPIIVVTATRLPTPVTNTTDVHVIDAKDIQALQLSFAADALATIPGLSVTSGGQFGLTSVSMRGAPTDKTLVLIDGVPVNDASQPEGGFDFAGLDLADVSRIEVLSGPQASLWGSNAIGGLISITTREPNGVRLDAETGSYGTTHLSGAVGRVTDQWAFGLTASDFGATGVSAADTRNNYAPYGYPGLRNTEPDGFRDVTFGVNGRYALTSAIELDGQLRYMKSHTDIDGYPAAYGYVFADTHDVANSESLLGVLRAKIDGPLGVHQELSFSDDHLKRGDIGDSFPGGYGYVAGRQVYRWTAEKGGPSDPVAVEGGVERESDRASLSTGDSFNLGNWAGFIVGRWRPTAALTTTASVRYDKPDLYGGVATGHADGVYELGAGFNLSASIGQGFKTPTISETACDFCFPAGPSTGLRPEHALGYDLGLGWRSPDGRFSLKATGYGLDIRDEIIYSDTYPYRYVNLSRTRTRGAELEGQAQLGAGFRLKGSYSYTDAKDVDSGVQLLRVPRNSGSAALLWERGPLDAAFTVRSESDQADTGLDGLTPLSRPGFTVANLAGGYALTNHVRLTVRVENLANSHYQQEYGYGEPGRAVYVGVHFRD